MSHGQNGGSVFQDKLHFRLFFELNKNSTKVLRSPLKHLVSGRSNLTKRDVPPKTIGEDEKIYF